MNTKVMLVEDEEDLVTLLRFIFEKFGYKVMEAHNGAEALKMLGIEPHSDNVILPDVIVTDVMMPGIDGFTFINKLQEHDSTRKIPVIVMTAKGQTKDLFQSSSNISGFLEKPFEPKTLRDTVEKVLKNNGTQHS